MRELAKLKLTSNKAVTYENQDLIDERIDTVYDLGYVYDPYKDKFWNPFFDTNLFSNDIYAYETNALNELHNKKVANKGQLSVKFDYISDQIYKRKSLTSILFKLGPIFGILFMISAIICFFTVNTVTAVILCGLSILTFNLWTVKYQIKQEYETSSFGLPMFFIQKQTLLIILTFVNYGLMIWFLINLLDSYWIPFLIVVPIIYLLPLLARPNLSTEYWKYTGINSIRDFAEENNVL